MLGRRTSMFTRVYKYVHLPSSVQFVGGHQEAAGQVGVESSHQVNEDLFTPGLLWGGGGNKRTLSTQQATPTLASVTQAA